MADLAATAALWAGIKNHKASEIKKIQGTPGTDDNLVDREASRIWLPGYYPGPLQGGLSKEIKKGDFWDFNALYSTQFHLSPFKLYCVGGFGLNPGLLRLWH